MSRRGVFVEINVPLKVYGRLRLCLVCLPDIRPFRANTLLGRRAIRKKSMGYQAHTRYSRNNKASQKARARPNGRTEQT